MSYDYDLFVIGAGSGGVRCSRMAAAKGAKVAVAEEQWVGGTCVNVGCVPKKLFVYAAQFSSHFEDAKGFGWSLTNPRFDWATLRDNKTREIERLNGIYRNLLASSGVTLLDGHATIKDAHTVQMGERTYRCQRILVATGGWPFVPDIPGKEHIITSNEAFYLEHFPKRTLIVGGGYIALEFASIFAGLGSDTTLSYRKSLFLRDFDQEIRENLRDEMSKHDNLTLAFNSSVQRIERLNDSASPQPTFKVHFADGQSLETDCVFYATGRVPRTHNLGLDNVGITLSETGAIPVNDNFQTCIPSIYALGDVIGRFQLTPVALAEGMALANHLFDNKPIYMDYSNTPTAVFCQPNVGTVGLSEEHARIQYSKIRVFRTSFRHMKHTLSQREDKTFMKLIVDAATDRVVGCHMIGDDAGEIIQGMAIAIQAGATKDTFDRTIGIHPTAAEEFVTMRS